MNATPEPLVLAHIAEYHRLDGNNGAHRIVYLVDLAVLYCAFVSQLLNTAMIAALSCSPLVYGKLVFHIRLEYIAVHAGQAFR